MKIGHGNRGRGAILAALTILASGNLVSGQVGQGVYLPSTFGTPSTNFGHLGGRYSNTYSGGFTFAPGLDAGAGGLLATSLSPAVPGRGQSLPEYGGGQRAFSSSPLSLPSPISTLRPLGAPMAAAWAPPLPSSAPGYGPTFIPGRNRSFDATVDPDSLARVSERRPVDLKKITPVGPGAGAVQATPLAQPVTPEEKADALKEMSQRQAAKLSGDGAATLQKAMAALKEGHLRGNRDNPGAVDLFRRARLLAGQQPEPTLGLIASQVMTSDYNQAAVLIGPLLRKWPAVLANTDFAQDYYGRPEQMRTHLLAIREAAIKQGDPDLRLLLAFYRWYVENRQQAVSDADQLARLMGPDSPAAAMVEAMRAALASGG